MKILWPWGLEWNARNPRLLWENLSADEQIVIRVAWKIKNRV